MVMTVNPTKAEPPIKVKCLKAFMLEGKVIEPGKVVELEALLARDLVARERARLVE